jgi:hypothetical protein
MRHYINGTDGLSDSSLQLCDVDASSFGFFIGKYGRILFGGELS